MGDAGKIDISPVAVSVPFNNSTDGYAATNVQAAIEEAGNIPDAETVFVRANGNNSTGVVGNRRYPYLTIVAALAAITDNASSKPYKIDIGPGIYTESQITMKPFVYLEGCGEQSTVIQPSNASQNFILMVENSMVRKCFITGVTGSGFAAIYMSSATGTDQTPAFIEDCKLGNNDTHAIVSPVNANNGLFFNNCEIGGAYQFNNGFKATTTGTGIGRIVLKDTTTTSMSGTLPNYVAYATGASCEILIDGCSFRTGGTSTGSCIQADTGALLRVTGLNMKGFGKAVWLPNTGAAPTAHMGNLLLESNTVDVQIDHPTAVGSIIGIATLSKITNTSTTFGTFVIDQATGASSVSGFRTQETNTATAASTLSLVGGSSMSQRFTGSTAGQIVQLPNATTLSNGHRFEFWNDSSVLVTIQDNGGTTLLSLAASQYALFVLNGNGSAAGTWDFTVTDYTPNANLANSSSVFDDFLAGTATGVSTLGNLRWTIFEGGTGNVTQPSANTDNLHIGVGNLAVSAVSDIASLAIADIRLGGGQFIIEMLVRVGALGTGTQNYVLQCGLGNNETVTTDPTNGLFFEYSQAGSTLWRVKNTASSTTTTTASTVTVTANSWYKLKMIINAAGTSVQYYISPAGGGIATLMATVTTNIPTSTTNIRPFFKIRKTVGATADSFDVDYFQMNVAFTTLR